MENLGNNKATLGNTNEQLGTNIEQQVLIAFAHFEAGKDAHSGVATGVTFSPLNKLLLVSVGRDNNALFYDIRLRSRVKCLSVCRELTAVALASDGTTMVSHNIRLMR